MRIVLRFSNGCRAERLMLGSTGPHRVDVVLDGGAHFGPRPFSVVAPVAPDPIGAEFRMAFDCGLASFDTFMRHLIDQGGKAYDWTWLAACKWPHWPRDWRRAPRQSWSGPEMVQEASEVARMPLVESASRRVVTVAQVMNSTLLRPVGVRACSDSWERWKVWGWT